MFVLLFPFEVMVLDIPHTAHGIKILIKVYVQKCVDEDDVPCY